MTIHVVPRTCPSTRYRQSGPKLALPNRSYAREIRRIHIACGKQLFFFHTRSTSAVQCAVAKQRALDEDIALVFLYGHSVHCIGTGEGRKIHRDRELFQAEGWSNHLAFSLPVRTARALVQPSSDGIERTSAAWSLCILFCPVLYYGRRGPAHARSTRRAPTQPRADKLK